MRLIDADAQKKFFENAFKKYEDLFRDAGIWEWSVDMLTALLADIDLQPTIEERKSGRWIRISKCIGIFNLKCSECGELEQVDTPFCPECGAKMRGEEHEVD